MFSTRNLQILHIAVEALRVGCQLCNINLGHKHAIVLWIYRAIVCALKTFTGLLNSSLVISFLTTIFITWVLCLNREYFLCDCKVIALSSAVLPQGWWWSNSNFMIYHSTENNGLITKDPFWLRWQDACVCLITLKILIKMRINKQNTVRFWELWFGTVEFDFFTASSWIVFPQFSTQ